MSVIAYPSLSRTSTGTKYPSCPNCAAQFPAPPKGKKFDPICTNCELELRLRCDYCDIQYTPKRWVFTTENREGNLFCSPACKKRFRAEQLSKEKAELRAELFKPRQCARKGAPTAREEKYRIDCPVVFTPVRVKEIHCSDECKDMARYYDDPKKLTYANARHAADPLKFRARAKKYRKRKVQRLGIHVVRALEHARYPAKKARREARRAAEVEQVAKATEKVEALKVKVAEAEAAKEQLLAEQAAAKPRSVGRPPNKELARRVRELRVGPKPISWARVKLILDRETGEQRALSTYRGYAENS